MDEKLIYEHVGKRIRQLRDQAGITQEALADALGVSRASIANYESGKQAVSLSDVYKIADTLTVQIKELLPNLKEIKERSAPEQVLKKAKDLKKGEKEEIIQFIEEIT